jgi:hypothetical protein
METVVHTAKQNHNWLQALHTTLTSKATSICLWFVSAEMAAPPDLAAQSDSNGRRGAEVGGT